MFTGIVQGLGEVVAIASQGGISRLTIRMPGDELSGLTTGASIAINGTCLTVVTWNTMDVSFDVIDETLKLTNLGALQAGDLVNVERAARFGDEIGGHLLSGHIHGRALVERIESEGDNLAVWWSVKESLHKYILPKGYVALNGCSLTVGETQVDGCLSVHLIPETRRITTFGAVRVGDRLNVEIDTQTQAIVDTVERVMAGRQS
jgi:riboflavin synthase, alpha subunit